MSFQWKLSVQYLLSLFFFLPWWYVVQMLRKTFHLIAKNNSGGGSPPGDIHARKLAKMHTVTQTREHTTGSVHTSTQASSFTHKRFCLFKYSESSNEQTPPCFCGTGSFFYGDLKCVNYNHPRLNYKYMNKPYCFKFVNTGLPCEGLQVEPVIILYNF